MTSSDLKKGHPDEDVTIDREKILQTAHRYVERKRYDRAIQEYLKIVEQDPHDARTLLRVGDLQARLRAYPEAIKTYDRVGQYYASQGFALKAIAVYKQIRELIRKHAPELSEQYSHIVPRLAEIYTQLGLTSDALSAYDEMATRLQRSGRDREAVAVFDRMVQLDPNNPLPHLRHAEACCRIQDVDSAINSFWMAADLLLRMQREDDALRVIERILHFRSDPRFARVAADLYLRRGGKSNGLQALTKLQIAFQADPKNLETLGLLAQAFTLIEQEDKSLEVYKEMARISREQNRADLFGQLLEHLKAIAPNDEQVRALESLGPVEAARRDSLSSAEAIDDEVELVEEELEPIVEEPPGTAPDSTLDTDVVVLADEDATVTQAGSEAEVLDVESFVQKALLDAESFRKLRLFAKAVETLHSALGVDPYSIEVRQRLREVLVEAGDREGAIAETINIATLYIDHGEYTYAEALAYEILEIEPDHPEALQLLELIPAQTGGAPYSIRADGGYAADQATIETAGPESYDPNGPLPAYELDGGTETADHNVYTFDAVDAPFGDDAPLPSFPLANDGDDLLDLDAASLTGEVANSPAQAGPSELEEVLEEAEFFTTRGLYEDARAVLTEQLTRAPNHPLLLERLREVQEALATAGQSGTIERTQLAGSDPTRDRAFDIAASLDALDDLENPLSERPAGLASVESEVDVDQVFQKFKEGVRAQVSENDSSTHYDLGVAYKEMGLLTDALTEFELASRDAQRECMCFAMIGMIHLEQEHLDEAASAYLRALNAAQKTVDQEMSIYYDLGNVYEMKGQPKEALYYFEKVARRDPGYRDVSERVAALKPVGSKTTHARAVNDDDEFDRVFDDLFGSK